MSVTTLHDLTGVYALDALDREEARAFEAHMEGCAACRREVQQLQEVAAALALLDATAPPRAIRQRVFAEIAEIAEIPGGPEVTPPAARAPTGPPPVGARRSAAIAAAAAILLVLVGGVALRRTSSPVEDAGAVLTREAAVAATWLQDPDARVISLGAAPDGRGATGQVRWSPRAARGVLTFRDLPAAGPGEVYEVWYVDGTARRGPLFDAGATSVVLTGQGEQPPATFAVTIEPAGGGDRPTGPVVLSGGAGR